MQLWKHLEKLILLLQLKKEKVKMVLFDKGHAFEYICLHCQQKFENADEKCTSKKSLAIGGKMNLNINLFIGAKREEVRIPIVMTVNDDGSLIVEASQVESLPVRRMFDGDTLEYNINIEHTL